MTNRKSKLRERTVLFEIKTRIPLPIGQQVFIAGNQKMLGNWRPDGFPLTRMDENIWTSTAILPATQTVEYKITRGSWEEEEIMPDGSVSSNSTIPPGRSTKMIHHVYGWKDQWKETELM